MSSVAFPFTDVDALRARNAPYYIRADAVRRAKYAGGRKRARPSSVSKAPWMTSEVQTLKRLYPLASWPEIHKAIPRHTKRAIKAYAQKIGLRRADRWKPTPYPAVNALRARRRALRLSQDALADKIGVHRVALSQWEVGKHLPGLRIFFAWVQALGLTLEFGGAA